MRLLVDANLSPQIASHLRSVGFGAVHVGEVDLVTATDSEISEFARRTDMVVVSADSDFATLLALSNGVAPSLVLLRSSDRLTPQEQAALLQANLPALQSALDSGAVATIAGGRVRVRRLPMRPGREL